MRLSRPILQTACTARHVSENARLIIFAGQSRKVVAGRDISECKASLLSKIICDCRLSL
jgi:hypothetical protein